MARRRPSTKPTTGKRASAQTGRPSVFLDMRIAYCGDCLNQLKKLPDGCFDLCYIDPSFSSRRYYEVLWGKTIEKRAFGDRHASTQAYIDYMRPHCAELQHVLRTTGTFRLRTLPPTQYYALRMKNCIASFGSGASFCEGKV